MMNKLDKSAVEKIRGLQTSVPVHVVPIANAFGVDVLKNRDFPDNLSGLIKKETDGVYRIYVNANHPITRQRFTIAHELAHLLLHKDKIGNGITDDYLYRSGLSNQIEKEANDLAADILMPKHLLLSDTYAHMTISQQAEEFWVSRTAMDLRLGKLLK